MHSQTSQIQLSSWEKGRGLQRFSFNYRDYRLPQIIPEDEEKLCKAV